MLLVDDHPIVRRGLADLIDQEDGLAVCGEADDARAAVELFRELQPDLVVVDITLKDTNGLELIKDLKARDPDVRLLVASMRDERVYAERALRAGALGYVSKEESGDLLVQAIRAVLAGRVWVSQPVSQRALQRMVGANGNEGDDAAPPAIVETLSDRELEVFELIGRGHSTREIADSLHRSVKTIESHRENIKDKLALANAHELVQRAVAWVLEER